MYGEDPINPNGTAHRAEMDGGYRQQRCEHMKFEPYSRPTAIVAIQTCNGDLILQRGAKTRKKKKKRKQWRGTLTKQI